MTNEFLNNNINCRIFLRGHRLYCKIGIDAAEREISQCLWLDVDMVPATAADNETPAVDYAAVIKKINDFANAKHHTLMEHFAHDIAQMILAEFAVTWVRVCCRKPHPFAHLAEAGVEVVCSTEKT